MNENKGEFIQVRLDNPSDIFKFNHRFMDSFVYRGHANHEWKLVSSLYRFLENYHPNIGNILYSNMYEREMIKDFKYKYQAYTKNSMPNEDDMIEWLSIMQHYGAPTRLIDFSYSPYIALFMALSEFSKTDSDIWCLNRFWCRTQFCNDYNSTEKKSDINEYIYEKANQMILDVSNSMPCKRVYLIKPKLINERLIRQQGLFAILGEDRANLIENLEPFLKSKKETIIEIDNLFDEINKSEGFNSNNYALIRIIIPKEFKFDLMYLLNKMNINAETIYPGLEGLGRSMMYQRYESYDDK